MYTSCVFVNVLPWAARRVCYQTHTLTHSQLAIFALFSTGCHDKMRLITNTLTSIFLHIYTHSAATTRWRVVKCQQQFNELTCQYNFHHRHPQAPPSRDNYCNHAMRQKQYHHGKFVGAHSDSKTQKAK